VWLGIIIYALRENRKQFRFEVFFFATLSIVAVFVLVLGFSIPYIDDRFFYVVYTNGIGLAFVLTVVALISIPDLVRDLAEAGRIKYSASTLGGIDVDARLQKLEKLIQIDNVYQDEDLTLSSLADALDLSGQQLSELINTRIGMGFSQYVRERRVEAAKRLLVSAPDQSILSISLDVGFKSQSNFYAAFKEITGMSPGGYRRANS
jgi:AraC-like DNA-binding protein